MEKPCSMAASDVLADFQTLIKRTFSDVDAASRLQRYGPNQLIDVPADSIIVLLLKQLCDPIVWLLFVAAMFSLAASE